MSGHNKWAQIKRQKGITDTKRGLVFSKLLKAIAIAAREEPDPACNPRLRAIIEKARENAVPNDTIQRAIHKTKDSGELEELTLEAYGPGGIAFLILIITGNRNRTINEIKHLLATQEGTFAKQGSVCWAFNGETPKFPQSVTEQNRIKIQTLIEALENHTDVQKVITNIQF